MGFNLKRVLCGLAICTVTHGKGLPISTATSSYNVPSFVGSIEPSATSASFPSVLNSIGHSEPTGTLVPRERSGFCDDTCAYAVDGEARAVKMDFEKHCSSFLSTTIASTVVTVTSTSTITIFDNNVQHRPSLTTQIFPIETTGIFTELRTTFTFTSQYNPSPTTVSNSIRTGTDGNFTILPSYIPHSVPLHWPDCANRKYSGQNPLFTKQFKSVCSCQGIMPATTTVAAVTNTVIEEVPTAVPFKIKAQFSNQKVEYLMPYVDKFRPRKTSFIKDMNFIKTSADAQLFSLTADGYLKSQGNGTLGWIRQGVLNKQINGRLVFLEETFAERTQKAIFPQFNIMAEGKAGKWHYKLVLETRGSDIWAVTLPLHNDTVPDERFLMLQSEDQMKEYQEKFEIVIEEVQLFVEPASEENEHESVD
ncbi:hypothetical protein N431DRAFT_444846 [Stipitochalara longipes BDJ]|nr:hypothetical protein N431DRAFT_444846 [Stipitochalara longipes BDJ]